MGPLLRLGVVGVGVVPVMGQGRRPYAGRDAADVHTLGPVDAVATPCRTGLYAGVAVDDRPGRPIAGQRPTGLVAVHTGPSMPGRVVGLAASDGTKVDVGGRGVPRPVPPDRGLGATVGLEETRPFSVAEGLLGRRPGGARPDVKDAAIRDTGRVSPPRDALAFPTATGLPARHPARRPGARRPAVPEMAGPLLRVEGRVTFPKTPIGALGPRVPVPPAPAALDAIYVGEPVVAGRLQGPLGPDTPLEGPGLPETRHDVEVIPAPSTGDAAVRPAVLPVPS